MGFPVREFGGVGGGASGRAVRWRTFVSIEFEFSPMLEAARSMIKALIVLIVDMGRIRSLLR